MATIPITVVVKGGIQIPFTAAASPDQFLNDGNVMYVVQNDDASPTTVTFDSPAVDNFGVGPDASHDAVGTVPAGERHVFGPFTKRQFNDGSDFVQVTMTNVTSIFVAALEFVGAT